VAIKNTDALMGKGTGEATTGTIEMVLLRPVDTVGISTDAEVQELLDKIQRLIAEELGVKKITRR